MHYYTATDEGSWCKGYNSTTALTICKDYKGPFSYHHILDFFLVFTLSQGLTIVYCTCFVC